MNSNGFSATDMSTAAANGHRDGYQAGYADAVKAIEAARPSASLVEIPESVMDAVADAIGSGVYYCNRTWSAWSYGTMRPDDFHPVADDGDHVADICRAAITAMQELAPVAAAPVVTADEREWLQYAIDHMRDDSEPEDVTCADVLEAFLARIEGPNQSPAGSAACPITGLPFYGNMEHPERGLIAMYGGPFDVYSVPELDTDNELRRERFDLDRDAWVEGGEPLGYFYSGQQPEAASTPAAPGIDLRQFRSAVEAWKRDAESRHHAGEIFPEQEDAIWKEADRLLALIDASPKGGSDATAFYDASAKGFHISETCGPDGKYHAVSKFQTLADLHAFEDARRTLLIAERDRRELQATSAEVGHG